MDESNPQSTGRRNDLVDSEEIRFQGTSQIEAEHQIE